MKHLSKPEQFLSAPSNWGRVLGWEMVGSHRNHTGVVGLPLQSTAPDSWRALAAVLTWKRCWRQISWRHRLNECKLIGALYSGRSFSYRMSSGNWFCASNIVSISTDGRYVHSEESACNANFVQILCYSFLTDIFGLYQPHYCRECGYDGTDEVLTLL